MPLTKSKTVPALSSLKWSLGRHPTTSKDPSAVVTVSSDASSLPAAASQVLPSAGASVVVSAAARPARKVTFDLPTIVEAEGALTAAMRAAGRGEQIPADVRRAIEAAMEGLDNPFDDAADAPAPAPGTGYSSGYSLSCPPSMSGFRG